MIFWMMGLGWEVCVCVEDCRAGVSCGGGGVVGCIGGGLAPMRMLEDRSKGISSGGDGSLTAGCGEREVCWVEGWWEGMGLIGSFFSDADISAEVSWCCGM